MAGATEIHLVNVQPKADTPTLLLHMTQENIDKAQLEHGRSMLADATRLMTPVNLTSNWVRSRAKPGSTRVVTNFCRPSGCACFSSP